MWVDINNTDKPIETTDNSQIRNPEFSDELNDFVQKLKKNKSEIETVLQLNENQELKNKLESFLKSQDQEDKIKTNTLKVKLMTCKPEDIKSIIAEYVWYKIWGTEQVDQKIDQVQKENENVMNVDDLEQVDQAQKLAKEAEQEAKKAEQEAKEAKHLNQMYESLNKVVEHRNELLVWHDDVRKKTEKKAELAQKEIPEETRNQLKERGYNDKFINDYILARVTLNEVKWNPDFDKNQVAQFESGVNELSTLDVILKRLDNACNIPDTSLNSFSSENIAQTRTELFNDDPWIWNESLKIARESNKNSHDYSEVFPEKTEEEMIQTYWKFLPNDSKNLLNNYIQHLNDNTLDEYRQTDECKILLKAIDEIKTSVEDKTKDLVEELCIISQIKWMYMCMWEWEDFNLNKANEIQSENWVLTLNGHINWVDFSIRQDTKIPNARLQTSQKLVKSEDWNTFTIGWKDRFVDSNFILPSQDEVFQLAVESVNSDWILDGASDINEYQELLQEEFMKKADELYKDTKYVHHYMKNQVKWEKIIDDSLWLISKINPSILNNKTLLDSINQSTNKDLYDFLKILNFNIENSTDYEKDKLIKCIDVIQNIPTLYKERMNWVNNTQSNYPPIIKNYLENQAWISDWNENSKLKLVYDLFSKYNEYSMEQRSSERSDYNQSKEWNEWVSSKIIINDLYRDLVEFTTSGQSEVAVRWENENKEQQDRQDAKNIEKAIENMPDWDWS